MNVACEACFEIECSCADGPFDPVSLLGRAPRELTVASLAILALFKMIAPDRKGESYAMGVSIHHLPWDMRHEMFAAMKKAGLDPELCSASHYATLKTKSWDPQWTFFIDVPKVWQGTSLQTHLESHDV